MKKIIFGSGKVAQIIQDKSSQIIPRKVCDITDPDNIEFILRQYQPDIAINCAAKTNLEYCQENKSTAYDVNTLGAINLLKACSSQGVKLVHISSGCLFDGNHEIMTEEDDATPGVWYTRTKMWADQFIQNFGYSNFLILRPRQMISSVVHPTNMITKFLSFNPFYAIDEPNSLTCIEDFKDMIEHLLKTNHTGVFNCCNTGSVTPYEIALAIKEVLNPEMEVYKISYQELLDRLPNKRVNTLLSTEKLQKTGFVPRSGQESLRWCLENYGK